MTTGASGLQPRSITSSATRRSRNSWIWQAAIRESTLQVKSLVTVPPAAWVEHSRLSLSRGFKRASRLSPGADASTTMTSCSSLRPKGRHIGISTRSVTGGQGEVREVLYEGRGPSHRGAHHEEVTRCGGMVRRGSEGLQRHRQASKLSDIVLGIQ